MRSNQARKNPLPRLLGSDGPAFEAIQGDHKTRGTVAINYLVRPRKYGNNTSLRGDLLDVETLRFNLHFQTHPNC
jgi:hypothetical protein